MKNKFLYILIFSLFFIGATCKKDDKPTYYMPQEFKDYVYFPRGSYWVYEDTAGNKVDSLYLHDFNIYIYEDRGIPYNYERMVQSIFSSCAQSISTGSANKAGIYTYEIFVDCIETNYFKAFFIDISQESHSMMYMHIATYDSLRVNNIWYKDVACIEKSNSRYYWAKYIGLIKIEGPNNVYKLKSYFIND